MRKESVPERIPVRAFFSHTGLVPPVNNPVSLANRTEVVFHTSRRRMTKIKTDLESLAHG